MWGRDFYSKKDVDEQVCGYSLKIFWGCTRLADMLSSKYEDNALQIKEKSTERTASFFVLEVTARSAVDILDMQPNSAILFYRKIRMVISHHLA